MTPAQKLPPVSQLWIDRLEAVARQMPSDIETQAAFIFAVRDGDWPPAGSALELGVIQIRLGMALVGIYSAAATAAAAGAPIAVPLEELIRFLPFKPRASELEVIREQYTRACAEVALGNSPTIGVQ